ncbi:MAG TPA: polyprenyl synthetase family protein [Nitrososphaeraceae archaeon]|nr:polyprenyl synthetase family protein [Nitrososphaeraceae archaeon]
MKASSIRDELESNASMITDFIRSYLQGEPKELYQASAHYIKSGGKRLRPFMTIKSCEMLGGNSKRALPPAAAVEMIHNFSLVHDDIMDNDEMRHNIPTVHNYYGTPLAILSGDILFSKAFKLLVAEGRKVGHSENAISEMVARLSSACIYVCEGQATDVGMTSNRRFSSESHYINMIGKKTAALFEVSCALGALSVEDSDNKDVENLSSFGRNVGIAFQLIDDLIGIIGDPKLTGKSVGNDIREGKKTYPILLALRNAKDDEKIKIFKVFGKNCSTADIKVAVRTISNIGIEREVRKTAKLHIERAIKSIERYSYSYAKEILESSANFIVERSL